MMLKIESITLMLAVSSPLVMKRTVNRKFREMVES